MCHAGTSIMYSSAANCAEVQGSMKRAEVCGSRAEVHRSMYSAQVCGRCAGLQGPATGAECAAVVLRCSGPCHVGTLMTDSSAANCPRVLSGFDSSWT